MLKALPFLSLPVLAPEDGSGGGTFFAPSGGGDGDTSPSDPAGQPGGGEGQPTGGAPDWLVDKYAVRNDAGELDLQASIEKQAQSARDLYGKLSTKTESLKEQVASEWMTERGVPEDPADYAYPEGWDAPPEHVDEALRAWAKENGIGADAFQSLINDVWKNTLPDLEAEAQLLGKNEDEVKARIDPVNNWINANIDERFEPVISQIMQSAAGVEFMEALMSDMMENGFAPERGAPETGAGPLTRSQIREAQADPRFQTDPEYRAKVRRMWDQFAAQNKG